MLNEFKKQLLKEKILSGPDFSEDWLHICELSTFYNFSDLRNITAVMEIPYEAGSLVFRDQESYLKEEDPLDLLERFVYVNRLMDYQLVRASCGSLELVPYQKVFLVSKQFVLLPLINHELTIWLNPLAVHHVVGGNEGGLVTFTNGLRVQGTINYPGLVDLSAKAIYALALKRHYHSSDSRIKQRPLDYIHFSDTPFSETLSKHALLQQWVSVPDPLSPCRQELANFLTMDSGSQGLMAV
ncbi:hypothetical protein [Enterococcus sp. AZ109]|uniref:hypothetical protein n=1 Tax=Enterococcus sp. AZ109 TaxID=2774634 RepID=UPI003F1FC6FC